MDDYQIPERLVILRTAHWILNHRMDTALPGYLMLRARTPVNELSLTDPEALVQLGALMASTQKALNEILAPAHLYISRYGHALGHALHFHIIPVCGWVRQRFLGDPRYRILCNLTPRAASVDAEAETDGAELTLYIWREFCENPAPPEISGPPIHDVLERLKAFMSAPEHQPFPGR